LWPGGNYCGRQDNRAIFAAASHAQRAADFINRLQPPSAG
jgi:antirestriction protein ArdC